MNTPNTNASGLQPQLSITAQQCYTDTPVVDRIKTLFTMAIGLTSEQSHKMDVESVTTRSKDITLNDITPVAKTMNVEITRRAQILFEQNALRRIPKPNHWSNTERTTWLNSHSLQTDDRDWVSRTIRAWINVQEGNISIALEEARSTGANITKRNKALMRLIEAFFLPELRTAMIRRHDSMSRPELDARNSDQRPLTFWELVCDKFNDPTWEPSSECFQDLHVDLSATFPLPLASHDTSIPHAEATTTDTSS